LDDPDILQGRAEKAVDTPYGKVVISGWDSFWVGKLLLVCFCS